MDGGEHGWSAAASVGRGLEGVEMLRFRWGSGVSWTGFEVVGEAWKRNNEHGT